MHESQFHMVCVLLCCFRDGRGIGECKLSNGFLTRFGSFDFFGIELILVGIWTGLCAFSGYI